MLLATVIYLGWRIFQRVILGHPSLLTPVASRAMAIYAIDGKTPRIHPEAYVHPDAVVIGDVTIGRGVDHLARGRSAGGLRHHRRRRPDVGAGRHGDPRHGAGLDHGR